MVVKYASSKIIKTASSLTGLATSWSRPGLVKQAANNLASLDLDPDNNIYVRNRSVSALELHGANQNFDAFEHDELHKSYASFIGNNISVDHIGTDKIGTVLDSEFIPNHSLRASLGLPMMPLEASIKSLNNTCLSNRDVFDKVLKYAESKNLVKGSDQKRIIEAVCTRMANTGWVENIWAIDKELANNHTQGLTDAVLNNEVTDSSMGTMVDKAVCSYCGNVATGLLPEHEDFCDCIRLYKGQEMHIDGIVIIPFELNRDLEFFEDSLILPFQFGGRAGGEGADKDAKLLEVFSNKHKAAKKASVQVKSYMETTPNQSGAGEYQGSAENFVMLGDIPENVEQNRTEFLDEKKENMEQYLREQSAPGEYPEGTILTIQYENEETEAVVVSEYDDDTLVVAMEDVDEPKEIPTSAVIKIIELPEDLSYEHKMDINDVSETERHPEKRSASIT